MQRVFWWGACGLARPRRGSLTVPLELGSRESVKLHQNGRITEIAAHSGGFFSGGAQRLPGVFLGGMRFGAPASWRTFLFLVGVADTLRVVVKWKWTQSISKTAIFLAYIAVPYNAVLLDCVQRGGYLS